VDFLIMTVLVSGNTYVVMLLTLLYGDIFLKKCLVEFVDGWRFKCTELHPKCRQSASDHYVSAGRSSSLLPSTSSIWSGRCSHMNDMMLHYIFWLEYTLLVASALATLRQHVLNRSAAEDGPIPVNSSTLWTNLRLLIKMIW